MVFYLNLHVMMWSCRFKSLFPNAITPNKNMLTMFHRSHAYNIFISIIRAFLGSYGMTHFSNQFCIEKKQTNKPKSLLNHN